MNWTNCRSPRIRASCPPSWSNVCLRGRNGGHGEWIECKRASARMAPPHAKKKWCGAYCGPPRRAGGAGPGDRRGDRVPGGLEQLRSYPGAAPRLGKPKSLGWRFGVNVNCDIIVPANPLSGRGLATPYQLTGPDGMTPAESGCRMSNAVKLGAFVQATILDPATGALSVYDPLVVTQGTRPAVRPSVPTIPANAVVTIDLGVNGKGLFQVGATPSPLA